MMVEIGQDFGDQGGAEAMVVDVLHQPQPGGGFRISASVVSRAKLCDLVVDAKKNGNVPYSTNRWLEKKYKVGLIHA
jgi:hypothetical protein